ncbi:BCCT family transporter [Acidaminobacter sp. JC074]|uniref:BCCT family transporter n=1 Tax=Acidaminobacter sp. JC074 TaxID=2530199 RepID=UPI001F0F6FF9|nr:BCCT family transporter [Acidaminobacter sp. JC074]MCH4886367.1 BCCT family transporter [Acidaminobacter sp. JC074]
MLKRIDKWIIIPSLSLLTFLSLQIIFRPEESKAFVYYLKDNLLYQSGFLFTWYGVFALIFVLWIAFSKYGKIKLGDSSDKVEFSNFSWAAMLFCAGIGASIIYWGTIEWAYYYKALPYGLAEGSFQAAELAATYGIFHWGPTAWAIYLVSASVIAYMFHVKKVSILRMSEACRPILGEKTNGVIGKSIDILFIIGLLGGAGTSLGLGTPLATEGIAKVFNLEVTRSMQLMVLFLITSLFMFSAYSGLKKGIKVLSDINMLLAIALLIFVFLVSDKIFTLNMASTSLGLLVDRFPIMMTWLDPVGKSGFPQDWTVFYWAWWIAYAPFMSLFIAKISKGRTIKNMLLGAIVFGSLGCAVFFIILGNYGLNIHLTGVLDVISSLDLQGGAKTIIEIFSTMPFAELIVSIVTLVSIIFMATTFDSASYVIAATVQKDIKQDEEPIRWLRVLCAFTLSVIPIGFILMGSDLSILQTSSIVTAMPVMIIGLLTAFSFVKEVKTHTAINQEMVVLVKSKEEVL